MDYRGVNMQEAEARDRLSAKDSELARLRAEKAELVAALEGVVKVADRKTVEFDRARAAIAAAKI